MDLLSALSWHNLLAALIGTAAGIGLGALPGVGTILSVTLLLPLTVGMPPDTALIMLGGVFSGAVYGGSVTAILINVPGTAANAVTSLDGYPLAKRGKAGFAIGVATGASAVGGLAGTVALIVLAPMLAKFALAFGPREYFMMALLGIAMIARATPEDTLKGLVSGLLGMFLGTIGLSSLTAYPRFTFGIPYLYDGIVLVPTVVGIFGLSEVLILLRQSREGESVVQSVTGGVLSGALYPFRKVVTLVKSVIIGIVIGVIPGVGGEVSNTLAYTEAKRSSRHPETFGTGEPEALVAAESANNASVSSSLAPLLTLGIPGSAVAALFAGALLIHGLRPGRDFLVANSGIAYTFFAGLIIANLLMLSLGLIGAAFWARLGTIQPRYLIGPIVLLCMTGAFAVRNSVSDMVFALGAAFVGYALRRGGYSLASFLIGLVVGPIAEEAFGQGMLIGRGNYFYFFQSWPALLLFGASLVLVLQPVLRDLLKRPQKGLAART